MTQGARNRTLTKLRHGDVKVLVATDVAARGIDVLGISHVINYDLPKFAEDYVHRIGRTGRAGNTGIAVSFASHMDRHQVRKIEQFTGQRIEPTVIVGFEPKRPAPRTDRPAGDKPRGRSNGGGYAGRQNTGNGFKPREQAAGSGYRGNDANRSTVARPASDRPEGNRNDANRGGAKFGSSKFDGAKRSDSAARRPRTFA